MLKILKNLQFPSPVMAEEEISNEKAEEAMKSFADITGTDEVLAQSILQDVNWKLETALDVFYGQNENSEDSSVITIEAKAPPTSASSLDGLEISLVTWNIDGLDGSSLSTRMLAVYKILKNVNADFVFLQEVVEQEIKTIDKLDRFYNIHYSDRNARYFTAILTSKMFKVIKHEVLPYQNSVMERTLQIIQGKIGEVDVFLLNTHLESMVAHKDRRKDQFVLCMERCAAIAEENPTALIFFGGDLNLRDNEVSSVPSSFADAWMSAGSPPAHQYTWDTSKNSNKSGGGNSHARCRFDRLFWKAGREQLKSIQFTLEGKQRIRSCLCFPSDHWAIHTVFKF